MMMVLVVIVMLMYEKLKMKVSKSSEIYWADPEPHRTFRGYVLYYACYGFNFGAMLMASYVSHVVFFNGVPINFSEDPRKSLSTYFWVWHGIISRGGSAKPLFSEDSFGSLYTTKWDLEMLLKWGT